MTWDENKFVKVYGSLIDGALILVRPFWAPHLSGDTGSTTLSPFHQSTSTPGAWGLGNFELCGEGVEIHHNVIDANAISDTNA